MNILETHPARVPDFALPYLQKFLDIAAKTPGAQVALRFTNRKPYFASLPEFDTACNVVDCTVLIIGP